MTRHAVELQRACGYDELGHSEGFLLNRLHGLMVKLDCLPSSHEASEVGRNTSGTVMAWTHSRTGVARATSAPRGAKLAWLGLCASHSKAKVTVVVVLPLPSWIH
jgi:hypothetical protein